MSAEKQKVQCPVCKVDSLAYHQLEGGLSSNKCTQCDGIWICSVLYSDWLSQNPQTVSSDSHERDVCLESRESSGPRFCPECRYVLIKYRVGRGLVFSLDRCGHCGGIWFDKDEWDILKSRNLHDQVHLVFSQSWQANILWEERRRFIDEMWQSRLEKADLAEIQRIKEWLKAHPQSEELFAYLLSDEIRIEDIHAASVLP
ncbi:MAG: zf-TFIIB domain-containing protein [Cyanobacteria bacterium]|nr:zf-TFIIB domain-containing protein [Cyanobacteriota bacterium]